MFAPPAAKASKEDMSCKHHAAAAICSRAMDPRIPRSLPWRFGNYEVLERLGHHGPCELFRGRDLVTGAAVAIKLLCDASARAPEERERFLHEVQLLARIRHPGVVAVFAVGELDDDTYYTVGELVGGESLRVYLRAGPPPIDRALRLARQLAVGLRCVHEAGAILHDVKPGIAMLVADGSDPDGHRLKIVDVSLAEFHGGGIGRSERPRAVIGTAAYMSPDQIRGDPGLDARSDIYGFGVVLFEMLAGQRPFVDPLVSELVDAHLNRPPPSLRDLADVSAELEALVLGCLAKAAADRPPDMTHVIAALDRAIESAGAVDAGSSSPASPR
jgi:serine/threonine-protein kinase